MLKFIKDDIDLILPSIESHLKWKQWFSESQFYKVGLLYMGTRLYVNLAEAASTNHAVSNEQLTSGSSTSEKFINFLTRNKRKGGIPGVQSGVGSGSAPASAGHSGSDHSYKVGPAAQCKAA